VSAEREWQLKGQVSASFWGKSITRKSLVQCLSNDAVFFWKKRQALHVRHPHETRGCELVQNRPVAPVIVGTVEVEQASNQLHQHFDAPAQADGNAFGADSVRIL
jgi:hypothetical protein